MNTRLRSAALLFLLSGCITGRFEVKPPEPPVANPNYIVIPKSRAEVWSKAIPRLGAQFFVINNIDATSGLINVSYSGDPEKYVDGGTVTSFVENARGPRTYTFPASKAYQEYEYYNEANGAFLLVERRMSLEGRINIIVEDIAQNQTRVTANVRYVLTKSGASRSVLGGAPVTFNDTIQFNSGEPGLFPSGGSKQFWPTGRLEADILAAFQ